MPVYNSADVWSWLNVVPPKPPFLCYQHWNPQSPPRCWKTHPSFLVNYREALISPQSYTVQCRAFQWMCSVTLDSAVNCALLYLQCVLQRIDDFNTEVLATGWWWMLVRRVWKKVQRSRRVKEWRRWERMTFYITQELRPASIPPTLYYSFPDATRTRTREQDEN